MDDKLIQKLTKMKKNVDDALTAQSRAEGALATIMQDLEKRDGIKTVQALGKAIDEKESLLAKQEEKFAKGIEKLEKDYPWDMIN